LLYFTGIVANVLFGIGHGVYSFFYFNTLNEPALWFFSTALATIFNVGLNYLCMRECGELHYAIAVNANITLVLFSTVLTIVVTAPQTIGFAVVVFTCVQFVIIIKGGRTAPSSGRVFE
jgi:hypothetical protein